MANDFPPDELAQRRAARSEQSQSTTFQVKGLDGLADVIRIWIRENMPEFPSEEQALAVFITLMERSAIYWHRFAHPDKPIWTEEMFLGAANALFKGLSRSHLIWRLVDGKAVHFLDDAQVHQGDLVELKLEDGSWMPGRYAWDGKPGWLPSVTSESGALFPVVAGAILRWPPRAGT